MIEKKIKYDINIEKPSKTKPVKQGGVFNYLGKQKTVNAPVKWRSSKDHPIAHLSYITKDEQKILIDLNLYGSLKGKPNRGPFGLPSLQGSGGGSGGDGGSSGGDGSSGDGSSQETLVEIQEMVKDQAVDLEEVWVETTVHPLLTQETLVNQQEIQQELEDQEIVHLEKVWDQDQEEKQEQVE
jgi:hypothetical protein